MLATDGINLSRLDLNLLVHLEALLTERSVTRAAARVGLGQSAMSHNLARLRDLFRDELLTRGPDGMQPTPRGQALLEPVRDALAQVQALMARGRDFDPGTARRTFRVGLPDSLEILIIPALLARLRRVAPRVHLRLHSIDTSRLLQDLDTDRMDLAIGYGDFSEGQTHHKRRRLFSETYQCMFNAELTGISGQISLEDYVRLPHILTSLRHGLGGRGVVDDALDGLGLKRTVVLISPRFLAVPYMVARSAVVVTMHTRIAQIFSAELGLSLSPPPIDLSDIEVSALWHASYDRDAGHAWLRQMVSEVVAEL